MKKLAILLVIELFLTIPFASNATPLGSGQLRIAWSGPVAFNYYGDYDGTVISSNFGYKTGEEEIFCVSKDNANYLEPVEFYTISQDLDTIFASDLYEKLSQAAWIADNWTSWGTTDTVKVEAQIAVWKIMGVISATEVLTGVAQDIYDDAIDVSRYLTNNWYYAHSPSGGEGTDYQDYLTPVPEPITMLLLGFGLLGLGLARRKR